MSREEIQKLLGGYATGTLSEVERRALFEAALDDQELFDALAKEQALREVLDEPFARQQLLDALGPARTPARMGLWQWLRQPAALAAAGVVAILLVAAGLALRRSRPLVHPEYVAAVRTPAPQAVAPPPPAQKPKPAMLAEPRAMSIKPQARLTEPHTELPTPPIVSAQPQMANALLPAVSPPAPPRVVPIAPLAESPVLTAELARQLYSQANGGAMSVVAGTLSKTQAKMARAAIAVPAARNLGVRYGLLLKGADGEYAPARLGTEFHTGDSVRLRLEPNDSGYLYLFQRDASGGWRLASTQRVFRGQSCLLPASGALEYSQPGRKELLVVLSPREEPSLGSLDTVELDALTASASADILKATVSSGESAYAVDTRPRAGQQKVAFEITLQFR